MSAFSDGIVLPFLALALMGWVVPKLLAMVFDEGVKPLMVLTFVSVLILFGLSAVFFSALYVWQGAPLSELWSSGWRGSVVFFGRLGLSSALIWGPIMVLSVAGLPRNWVRETW